MINKFDSLFIQKNYFIFNFDVFRIYRFIFKLISTHFFCLYFHFTKNSYKQTNNNNIIVSITSYPERINTIWLTLESIMRQDLKPDKIILTLSKEEFGSFNDLPKRLKSYLNNKITLCLVDDNIFSHKKYYYTMQKYRFSNVIVLDDDIIYNSSVIRNLYILHTKYPDAVCCNVGRNFDLFCSNFSYNNATLSNISYIKSKCILPIGFGGVLYPPESLSRLAFDINAIRKTSFYADDLWLYFNVLINNNEFVKTENFSNFLPIFNTQKFALYKKNLNKNLNDLQIMNIINYFLSVHNINVYNFYSK
jgi:hypothetical protein